MVIARAAEGIVNPSVGLRSHDARRQRPNHRRRLYRTRILLFARRAALSLRLLRPAFGGI
jgi:hypothetical protein